MMNEKAKILFIAKNIPTPKKKNNRIIIKLAEELKQDLKVSFLHPRPLVPWGLHWLKKYKSFWGLESWNDDKFSYEIYKFMRLPVKKWAFLFLKKLGPKGRQIIKDKNPDLIHAHFIFPDGLIAYQAYKELDIPFIITVRRSDVRLLKLLPKESNTAIKAATALKSAHAVLALNKGVSNFLLTWNGIRSEIIPHGIEESAFKNTESYIDKNRNIVNITTIGNAISSKKIDWVIKAVKRYKGPNHCQLKVIGDGPELQKLKELGKESDKIQFTGRLLRKEVLSYLERSEIFALPSISETFGLVYLEAAAKKNAIIGFKKEGVWGVFEPEKEALFVDSYEEFEKTLHNLIDSPEKRYALAEAAYQKARTLTWRNIRKRYIHLYQQIIGNK